MGYSASIVIRCFNEERHISRLLSGIMQQSLSDTEIVIVDSGSTDATLAVASRYPVTTLSIRPQEFSFGGSLNMGCEAAGGQFIVIASAHVYPVYKDWLERLLAPFDDSKVALTYGKQRGGESTKYSEHRVFARWYADDPNPLQDHPFCNNANAAIRRAVWEHQPYDETLTGLEDIDWANRAMQQGHKISYVPDAEVVHVHSETPRQTYNRYRREAIALKRVFPHERFHLGDFLRLFLANAFSDYTHALRDGVLRRELVPVPRFRLMQFWGTYRGYAQRGPVTSQLRHTFYYPQVRTRARPTATGPDPDRRVEYASNPEEQEVGRDH